MKSKSILVIDDNPEIREAVLDALKWQGYDILTAANGLEGLARLADSPRPGLILLDLMMPVMDGWQFIEALNQNVELSKIPVVIMTAFSDRIGSIGARGVIKKPIDLADLMRVAEEYCKSNSA